MRASQTLGILILAGALIVSVPKFAAGQDVEITHGAGVKHKPGPTPAPGDPPWQGPGGTATAPTSGSWATGSNWGGGLVPNSGAALSFGGSGSTAYTSTDNIGTFVVGTWDLNSTASVTETIAGNSLTITGVSGSISQDNTGAFTISNNFTSTMNSAGTLTLTGTGSGLVTLSGIIGQHDGSHTVSLIKTGTSTFLLSGANTYSGGTTVSAGTLLVSNTTGSGTGSGNVTVNGGGTTLGGTGTISGSVTLSNGAILNPGPQGAAGTSASVGKLTTGALTLTGANTVHIDAFGTAAIQWDQLVSTGAISLGTTSTLVVIIASGLTFTSGTTYVLLNGTSLTGTFSGITNNQLVFFSGYEFIAEYTPTGFDLVVPVPEPGTWCAAALALGVIGYSQRRRFGRLLKSALA